MEPRLLLSADLLSLAGLPGVDVTREDAPWADADATDNGLASFPMSGESEVGEGSDEASDTPASFDPCAINDTTAQLVIVDTNVSDYAQLVDQILASTGDDGVIIYLLDGLSDGVEQITDVLAQHTDVAAVHLISHGSPGSLQLGNSVLNAAHLADYSDAISTWGESLAADADLLIYGCNLAASEQGQALVDAIGSLSGADVAASVDQTGHAAQGADWDLEYQAGTLEATAFAPGMLQTWQGTLATFTVDSTADTVDANPGDGLAEDAAGNTTLRAAIMEANALGGADTIFLGADTYSLTIIGSDDAAGDLDISDDLSIVGVSPTQTFIDGNNINRVLDVKDNAAITVSISNLKIENGITGLSGEQGGGLRIAGSANTPEVTLSNVWFTGNNALIGADGGAIYNEGSLNIENSLIEGNIGTRGGGVFNASGAVLNMSNVTLSGNQSDTAEGGALYNDGTATLRNITVAANYATMQGGGIYVAGGNIDMANSIVADNSAGGSGQDAQGTIYSSSYNIFEDAAGVIVTTGSYLTEDPLLGGLADNGGNLMTHAPAAFAVIDNSDPLLATAMDQRGFLRDDGNPDIGAHEVGASTSPTPAELWLSTDSVVVGGGQTGDDSWNPSDLIGISDPQLNLGPGTTSGTFSTTFDADSFANGWDLNAVHYVTAPIQIGSANFQLLAGDLLISPKYNGTIFTSNNAVALGTGFQLSVTADDEDLLVFRPDAAGDFTKGQFGILLENVTDGHELRGVTLVEQTITVGGYALQAGDFLYSRSGGGDDHSLWLYETDTIGAGATPNSRQEFLDGDEAGVGIQEQIHGIELLETTTQVGNQVLMAGTLLLNVDNTEAVGSNGLNVDRFDVFSLDVSTATLVGSGQATAQMLFDGSDVAFDSNEEDLDALLLAPTTIAANDAPTANQGGPYTIAEGNQLDLDGSASSDSDGSIVSWEWDIGDNGTFEKSGETVSYTWADLGLASVNDNGMVDVTLRVTDDDGAHSIQTFQVTVDNSAPTLTASGSGTVIAGSSYTLTLAATDPGNDLITGWVVDWGDGSVETIVGDPGTVNHTYSVGGLTHNILVSASDEDGTHHQSDLLVTARGSDNVLRFDGADGSFLQSFADGGELNGHGFAVIGPDGLLYVGADSSNIVRYDPLTGVMVDEFIASGSGIVGTEGLAFGPDGNLYVASSNTNEVLRFNGSTGAFIDVFAVGLSRPEDIAFGPDGNLYVANGSTDSVSRFDAMTGAPMGAFVTNASGGLSFPIGMAFVNGSLLVTSFATDEILEYDANTGAFLGTFIAAGSGGLNNPVDMSIGPDGELYVASAQDDSIKRYDGSTGVYLGDFVTTGTGGLDIPNVPLFVPIHQVSVTVPVNTAPTFSSFAGPATSGDEDTEITVTFGNLAVQGDEADADGSVDAFVVKSVTSGTLKIGSSAGTATAWTAGSNDTLNATTNAYWTPDAHANGTLDAFEVVAEDDDGAESASQIAVRVDVNAINDAPIASNLSSTSAYNEGDANVPIIGIVVSDVDTGENITATLTLADTSTGSLSANDGATYTTGTGVWTITGGVSVVNNALANLVFSPLSNNEVDTSIGVSIDDGDEDASGPLTGTIALVVTPVNDEQILAVNTGMTINEGSTGNTVTAAMLEITDLDNTADQLLYTLTGLPTNGSLNLNNGLLGLSGTFTQDDVDNGRVTYDHSGSENFTDSFSFSVDDGAGIATIDNFAINVTPVNENAPVADNESFSVVENGTATEADLDAGATLLVGDTDADLPNDTLSVNTTPVVGPSHGNLTLNGDGTFSYTHDGSENFSDSFTYEVQDANGATDTATVTITISPQNDAPILINPIPNLSITEDVAFSFQFSTDTFYDRDTGDNLTYGVQQVDGSSLPSWINFDAATRTFSGTPSNSDLGTLGIEVMATDGSGATVIDRFELVVINSNDTPTGAVIIDNVTPLQGDSLTVSNTLADADGLSGPINYQWQRDGVDITGATAANYTTTQADVSAVITVVASYTDDQGTAESISSAATATVNNVNNAPVIGNNSLSLDLGQTVVLLPSMLSASDIDNSDSSLTFTVSAISGGQFEQLTAPGIAITSFNQAELAAGQVVFVDDGDDVIPAYSITVSDGNASMGPEAATIVFNTPSVAVTAVQETGTTSDISALLEHEPAIFEPFMQVPAEPMPEDLIITESEVGESTEEEITSDDEDAVTAGEEVPDTWSTSGAILDDDPSSADNLAASSNLQAILKYFALRQTLPGLMAIADPALAESLELTTLAAEIRYVLTSSEFTDALDRVRQDAADATLIQHTVIGSSVVATTGLSVGYVAWLVRGGVLLSSVLSSLPAWQFVDPLPVLARTGHSSEDEDANEDSLESIIKKQSAETDTKPERPQIEDGAKDKMDRSTELS